jgi:hypothetical protein
LGEIGENHTKEKGDAEQQEETVTDCQCDKAEIAINGQVRVGCGQDRLEL